MIAINVYIIMKNIKNRTKNNDNEKTREYPCDVDIRVGEIILFPIIAVVKLFYEYPK